MSGSTPPASFTLRLTRLWTSESFVRTLASGRAIDPGLGLTVVNIDLSTSRFVSLADLSDLVSISELSYPYG